MEQQDKYVFFWGHHGKPGKIGKECLSQWYPSKFAEYDMTFNCAEQYMMYRKALLFNDTEIAEQILQSDNPKEIKALGRKIKDFSDKEWSEYREIFVYYGNCYKFEQNKELGDFLLSTGDKILVEASPYDKIWGIGMSVDDPDILDESKWKGQNLLGKTLMKVRDFLRKEAE